MTKTISLTKGKVALVDDADYPRVSHLRWCYAGNGYVVHYDCSGDKRKTVFLHRLIMNAPRHLQVDHINRDKLDNRRANLRFATRSQNQANKGIADNNTSGYKGVSFNHGKWEARIRIQRQPIYLGRFASPHDAALLYDAASRCFNGDFAGVNFPDIPSTPAQVEHLERLLARRPEVRDFLDRAERYVPL